jgi:hypothetical protein
VTDWPPDEPRDAAAVAERRDELVAAVREHADRVASELARLRGGDYGRATFGTDRGEWTLKYEGGDVAYLRFDARRGDPTYVVSSKRRPEPAALVDALGDYPAFVEAFDEHVASLDGVLDGVATDFPAVASTDRVVAERERVLGAVRETCDRMASELRRAEGGDYGTFAARVDGTRWELKRDGDRAAYLRVGGADGVYLLSKYGPPSAADVREYAPRFEAFVEAYNEHVAELERREE